MPSTHQGEPWKKYVSLRCLGRPSNHVGKGLYAMLLRQCLHKDQCTLSIAKHACDVIKILHANY